MTVIYQDQGVGVLQNTYKHVIRGYRIMNALPEKDPDLRNDRTFD